MTIKCMLLQKWGKNVKSLQSWSSDCKVASNFYGCISKFAVTYCTFAVRNLCLLLQTCIMRQHIFTAANLNCYIDHQWLCSVFHGWLNSKVTHYCSLRGYRMSDPFVSHSSEIRPNQALCKEGGSCFNLFVWDTWQTTLFCRWFRSNIQECTLVIMTCFMDDNNQLTAFFCPIGIYHYSVTCKNYVVGNVILCCCCGVRIFCY